MAEYWGITTSVDCYDCNPEFIRSESHIKQFVKELCEYIDMKRFGDTVVVHFGEDEKVAGYSMTQLIETSLVSGHFANLTNASYIDIFSCKWYDSEKAAEFTSKYFGAKSFNLNVAYRK